MLQTQRHGLHQTLHRVALRLCHDGGTQEGRGGALHGFPPVWRLQAPIQETALDRYPLPSIEDIFNQMGGATIFSKLDLRTSYHQIPLREEDWKKTTFEGVNWVLWEWLVVPFGLKNAPPPSSGVWTTFCGTCRFVAVI